MLYMGSLTTTTKDPAFFGHNVVFGTSLSFEDVVPLQLINGGLAIAILETRLSGDGMYIESVGELKVEAFVMLFEPKVEAILQQGSDVWRCC